MALENKKLEVAYEKQMIELMVRYQLEILLVGLREETLCCKQYVCVGLLANRRSAAVINSV